MPTAAKAVFDNWLFNEDVFASGDAWEGFLDFLKADDDELLFAVLLALTWDARLLPKLTELRLLDFSVAG